MCCVFWPGNACLRMIENFEKHSSFSNVFHRFRPCQRMRKHAFAGRNTQQVWKQNNYGFLLLRSFFSRFLVIWFSIYSVLWIRSKVPTRSGLGLSTSKWALEFSWVLVNSVFGIFGIFGPRVDGDSLPRYGTDWVSIVAYDVPYPDLKDNMT